jgi:hypothetical protein
VVPRDDHGREVLPRNPSEELENESSASAPGFGRPQHIIDDPVLREVV